MNITASQLISLLPTLEGNYDRKTPLPDLLKNFLPFLPDDLLCDPIIYNSLKNNIGNQPYKFTAEFGNLPVKQRSNLIISLLNEEIDINKLNDISSQKWLNTLPIPALIKAASSAVSFKDYDCGNSFLSAAIPKLKDLHLLDQAAKLSNTIAAKLDSGSISSFHRIALCSNCTCHHFTKIIPLTLMNHRIKSEVWEAPFNSWATQLIDTDSELYKFSPSFLIIYLSSLGLSQAASQPTNEYISILDNAINKFLQNSTANIILVLPEILEEELLGTTRLCSWRRELREAFYRFSGPRVSIIDTDVILAKIGLQNVFAPRLWYHAKMPMHPAAMLALGRSIALTIARIASQPIKVIACDLDNTLWGGVVGEDGPHNLRLDIHGTGGSFIRLQSFLKELISKGKILIAVSKNNLSDVIEVFNQRDEMILKYDDFSLVIANWKPKSENLSYAANTLNLGLQNFCFLDDSPFERWEVRNSLSDVIVPELPDNHDDYISYLVGSGLFQVPITTDEDKVRASMYKNEANRSKAYDNTSNIDDFLSGLDLSVEPINISNANILRVSQLFLKTNQFNLTTRRHDTNCIKQFSDDDNIYSHCYRVKDKFGDSGITGILIAKPFTQPDTYEIDSWILSCRVMGRTIEHALFYHLICWLQQKKIQKLKAYYIPTKKNLPVANLLPGLGFNLIEKLDGGVDCYEYDVTLGFNGNNFVKLEDS